jgi:hypothetical protein
MGDDGKIYTGYGHVMDLKQEGDERHSDPIVSTAKIEGQSLFPGIGGLFFLGLTQDGSLHVYQSGTTTPLCPLDAFPQWAPPMAQPEGRKVAPNDPPGMLDDWVKGPLTLDKRIVFAPAAGHLVFLPYSNDRLIQRKFDLKAALDRTGKDYLLVVSNPPLRARSGDRWNYRIETLQKHGPAEFKLEKAPEGMSMTAPGNLTWKIEGGIKGTAEVAAQITDRKGNVIRHSFTIAFE